jgi:alkyldihydroxyacetonephosphate synthase
LNVDIKDYKPHVNPTPKESDYPPPVKNESFINELTDADIEFSVQFEDRFLRCHAQGARDIYTLRHGKFDRVPDIVVWPKNHEEVEQIVKLCNKHYAVVIPCGGSTNTMLSLWYKKKDMSRLCVSLDTTQMSRILWIDKESMLACFEAGVVGKFMEDALEKEGLIVGHEPDSMEMSTVGGWVATRSSGMKQQTYGNIEDLVVKVTMVTSVGTLEKNYLAPRASIGPDFNHIALGSEGTMGVITKVVLKVRRFPQVRRFGSLVFPNFESGKNFMYGVSKFETKPSSLRLVDNYHIQLGLTFDYSESLFQKILKQLKLFGLHNILCFDEETFALATYLIEGSKEEADKMEKKLKSLANENGGVFGGEHFGKQTYLITSTNCYIRVS